ncbi:MAG: hypothetical protein WCE70_08795, partial [Rhodanobacteraceae bacterium]
RHLRGRLRLIATRARRSTSARNGKAIAKAENVSERLRGAATSRLSPGPDLMQRIVEGRQPVGMTVRQLLDPPPVDSGEQRRHFGLSPA